MTIVNPRTNIAITVITSPTTKIGKTLETVIFTSTSLILCFSFVLSQSLVSRDLWHFEIESPQNETNSRHEASITSKRVS